MEKNICKHLCLLVMLVSVPVLAVANRIIKINIQQKYGVSEVGINRTIIDSKRLLSSPNTTVQLIIPAGKFTITNTQKPNLNAIRFIHIQPATNSRLILLGAGIDKNQNTTLIFPGHSQNFLFSLKSSHITIKNIIFSRDRYTTVTQGIVTQVAPDHSYLDLNLTPGFPTPDKIYSNPSFGQWLRPYNVHDPMNPQIIIDDNNPIFQLYWTKALPIKGNVWRFYLRGKLNPTFYHAGLMMGVKSKPIPDREAYHIKYGDDITFDHLKWVGTSRGDFRFVNNIKILNCVIARMPVINGHVPLLATPAGGPQIGSIRDEKAINNVLVDHLNATATGDDSVAFFNVKNGTISNSHISDPFSHAIVLVNSNAVLSGNKITRGSIERCQYPTPPKFIPHRGFPAGTNCTTTWVTNSGALVDKYFKDDLR